MEQKARRNILGGLAALLVAPFLAGRDTVARAFAPGEKAPLRIQITPPTQSVKRRG